jgi:predicted nucleic acid-binding Zn ribbon protein
VHGLADCPACGRPAPAGELARWGHCSFCRRQHLAEASRPDVSGAPGPDPAGGLG